MKRKRLMMDSGVVVFLAPKGRQLVAQGFSPGFKRRRREWILPSPSGATEAFGITLVLSPRRGSEGKIGRPRETSQG